MKWTGSRNVSLLELDQEVKLNENYKESLSTSFKPGIVGLFRYCLTAMTEFRKTKCINPLIPIDLYRSLEKIFYEQNEIKQSQGSLENFTEKFYTSVWPSI